MCICMCVHVCFYACVYMYVYMNIYVCMCMCVPMCMCLYMCVYLCICIYIHTNTYIYAYICIRVYIYYILCYILYNVIYYILYYIKLSSKTCFLYSSGDPGVGDDHNSNGQALHICHSIHHGFSLMSPCEVATIATFLPRRFWLCLSLCFTHCMDTKFHKHRRWVTKADLQPQR